MIRLFGWTWSWSNIWCVPNDQDVCARWPDRLANFTWNLPNHVANAAGRHDAISRRHYSSRIGWRDGTGGSLNGNINSLEKSGSSPLQAGLSLVALGVICSFQGIIVLPHAILTCCDAYIVSHLLGIVLVAGLWTSLYDDFWQLLAMWVMLQYNQKAQHLQPNVHRTSLLECAALRSWHVLLTRLPLFCSAKQRLTMSNKSRKFWTINFKSPKNCATNLLVRPLSTKKE